MKESSFQTNVIKYLTSKGAYVVNIWGGGYQTAGVPDLLISYKGKFLGLELKVDDNQASEIQKYHIEQINKSKGWGLVFRHRDQWREDLDNLLLHLDQDVEMEHATLPSSFERVQRVDSITTRE